MKGPYNNTACLRREWLGELRPPACLSGGNVGTPRAVVLKAISSCRLPASAVSRLGISRKDGPSKGPVWPHVSSGKNIEKYMNIYQFSLFQKGWSCFFIRFLLVLYTYMLQVFGRSIYYSTRFSHSNYFPLLM